MGCYISPDKKFKLYYELSGNGKEKVVFTHGLNGGITDFAYFTRSFYFMFSIFFSYCLGVCAYPYFEVCNYYLRGCGLSEAETYSASFSNLIVHLYFYFSLFFLTSILEPLSLQMIFFFLYIILVGKN
jgi:hypothetical protein